MTRLSTYFLPTEKQAPADAEALSHKLMVRAGLIRQLGAGLWSFLPAGWRVHENVVQIIREEMNAIGGQELLMPVLNPADPWQRSGRYDQVVKLLTSEAMQSPIGLTPLSISSVTTPDQTVARVDVANLPDSTGQTPRVPTNSLPTDGRAIPPVNAYPSPTGPRY